MIKSKSFSVLPVISALAVALILLSGCGCFDCGNTVNTVDAPEGRSYLQLAPMAPPPPMFEEEPENYSPRAQTWRPGYWDYGGSNYHWVSGEFIARPSPTAVWSSDHWVQHTYGWGFVPGYWQ